MSSRGRHARFALATCVLTLVATVQGAVEGVAGVSGEEVQFVSNLQETVDLKKDLLADRLEPLKTKSDGVKGGLSDLADKKKEKVLGAFDDEGLLHDKLGIKDKGLKDKKGLKKGKLKDKLQETSPSDTYEKTKGILSRLLNLMGVDVGPDPLQDLLDSAGRRSEAATDVAGDFSSVLTSNLENLMFEKSNVNAARAGVMDAVAQNEAERWKSILRNFVRIEEGFTSLREEAEKFTSDICKPAEFVPPERKAASFSGLGASIEFNAGSCRVTLSNEFLDWELVLQCVRPSIKYTKTPPMYVSEHTTASQFKTRECKKERILGDEVEEVLHVFDGSGMFDPTVLDGVLGQIPIKDRPANSTRDPMADILASVLGKGSGGLFQKKKPKKLKLMDVLSKDKGLDLIGAKKLKGKEWKKWDLKKGKWDLKKGKFGEGLGGGLLG